MNADVRGHGDGVEPRCALVTGAATGIGLATVRLLAAEGWRVVATGLPGQGIPEGDGLEGVRFVEVDLADHASRERLLTILAGEPRWDALVSNAGFAAAGPVEGIPIAELRRQFDVNSIAPMALAQTLLPQLRLTRGRMIFVGAGQGRVALPFGGPYAASKAALAALTDALRAETAADGVTVSLIEPGAVRTGILNETRDRAYALLDGLPEEMVMTYRPGLRATFARSEVAFRRALPPETIARLILEILISRSPRPRYLVGREAFALAIVARLPARWRARLTSRLTS